MNQRISFLALPLLVLLCACGGGGSSSVPPTSNYATKLHYVNPTVTANHFHLDAEPATNDTPHLVLDLVGPTGTVAKGVAFFVSADSTATWGNPSGSDPYAKAGTTFTLGTPALFKSKLSSRDLQVGIYETGAAAVTLSSAPIVSLALDLASTSIPSGTVVNLTSTSGKVGSYLDGSNTPQTLVLDLGSLSAR